MCKQPVDCWIHTFVNLTLKDSTATNLTARHWYNCCLNWILGQQRKMYFWKMNYTTFSRVAVSVEGCWPDLLSSRRTNLHCKKKDPFPQLQSGTQRLDKLLVMFVKYSFLPLHIQEFNKSVRSHLLFSAFLCLPISFPLPNSHHTSMAPYCSSCAGGDKKCICPIVLQGEAALRELCPRPCAGISKWGRIYQRGQKRCCLSGKLTESQVTGRATGTWTLSLLHSISPDVWQQVLACLRKNTFQHSQGEPELPFLSGSGMTPLTLVCNDISNWNAKPQAHRRTRTHADISAAPRSTTPLLCWVLVNPFIKYVIKRMGLYLFYKVSTVSTYSLHPTSIFSPNTITVFFYTMKHIFKSSLLVLKHQWVSLLTRPQLIKWCVIETKFPLNLKATVTSFIDISHVWEIMARYQNGSLHITRKPFPTIAFYNVYWADIGICNPWRGFNFS